MIINKMTILFSQLKNFIQNDPLSDWFDKIHRKYNCYEKQNETSFEIELKEKKNQYKEDFFMFLKKYKYQFNINLNYN